MSGPTWIVLRRKSACGRRYDLTLRVEQMGSRGVDLDPDRIADMRQVLGAVFASHQLSATRGADVDQRLGAQCLHQLDTRLQLSATGALKVRLSGRRPR